ncbi:CIS tube protein [Demequina mangrovi]|uniref:Contractile injection system tube protein N-terminal domain-containing protein n=1 Tax=Demequina mangrovi TaxID=1043493 RepID=A0A1H6TS01_9MICO|nr:hypothetical protein [Demequina mangrovi]SEI82801.1 hypothetical protein SAMN05421637_0121 [Demequina mangrovi]
MELEVAELIPLKDKVVDKKKGTRRYWYEKGAAGERVQFNPTSLKISTTNNVDTGGSTTRTQKHQTPSVQPSTLSFDLEFDTAEALNNKGEPQDVRELTEHIRRFCTPNDKDPGKPPPALLFHWGKFLFYGIVTQLTEDIDYFSPDGYPLRAKVSVSMTEVNGKWDAAELGPGARERDDALKGTPGPQYSDGATTPDPPLGNGAGSAPTANPVAAVIARAGESVQQLLTRLDQDPETWRSAMAGLDSPLSLSAGAQVQLGAAASASAGLGVAGGATASASVSAEAGARAALGLEGGAAARVGGVGAQAAAGFALAEAGGIVQAGARADASAAASAQAGARAQFAVPLQAQASASASAHASAHTDARSLTFGRGVPLRARVSGDAAATPGP